ncbi:esterase [Chondrinema litorale]|uniref:esterase n=1 Tax=Chondrinema litorale TaxID=2994555 RepID=UPI0025428EC5|nr:esterase [Chondrinema litorale]UZR96827.1 alpha/beta hydrolase-fold protein [Chondrinema litorale]
MKTALTTILLALTSFSLIAQQNIFNRTEIVSPEINKDNTVTFRLKGPEASKVTISGSWMPSKGFESPSEEMHKGDSGVWTYTTEALQPELYRYSFSVNGVRTTDPSNAFAIRDVATLSNIFLIEGGKADNYKINDVPHGTVAYRWYDSPGNDKKRRLAVYTPAGYENSEENYPVLYLLHGIGGDEEAWLGSGRAKQIMDNLIAQGKVEPMIMVMPNGNVSQQAAPGEASDGFKRPTFMLPHTMDGKFEETFIDIIKFVESNYRTVEKKEGRAIAGLSMGGYHTAYISMNYPNTFDYVGLFSPAINVNNNQPKISVAYQNIDEKLKAQLDNGYKLYWIAVGKNDMQMLLDGIQKYRKDLDAIDMKYAYKLTEGGHTWENWRDYLVEFSQSLFKK